MSLFSSGVTVGEALHIYGNKVVLITGSLLIFTGQCGCALFPQLGFWWLLFMYGIVPGKPVTEFL